MCVDLCASPKKHNSFSVLLLDVKYDMKETYVLYMITDLYNCED